MKKFYIILLIFLGTFITSFSDSDLTCLTLEATALDIEGLEQKMSIIALKKFIEQNLDIRRAQKDIITKYFVAFKPSGYIKNIEIKESKRKDGCIWGKGLITISNGKTITGIRELIYDLGNPRVFVQTKKDVKLINLTQSATTLERNLRLGVDKILSSMVRSKFSEDGFTITNDQNKSDIMVNLYSETDLSYYRFKGIFNEINEGYSVTILITAELLDTESSNVIYTTQETSAPADIGSNPLFTISYLIPDLIDKVYDSVYPKMMNYIFNEYRKKKFVKFIGISGEEVKKKINELKEKLPALVDIKERKYGQGEGGKFVEYEMLYFGSMIKLLDILSEKYETSINNGEILVKPIICIIIFKNCEEKKIKSVYDYLEKNKINYKIEGFYNNTLVLSIGGIGIKDFSDLCLDKIPNSLGVKLLEFKDKKAILEF